MSETNKIASINHKIQSFKKKYYLGRLIKGVIISLALIFTFYLILSSLEYSIRFSTVGRFILFFGGIILVLSSLYFLVTKPLIKYLNLKKGISDEVAATKIGLFFPNVRDRLLNLIQLQKLSSENKLIEASIIQKSDKLKKVPFGNAVDLESNKRYLKFLVPPTIIILLLLVFYPTFLRESTLRIINFNKEYIPVAPFRFEVLSNPLIGHKNEDFTINLRLIGDAIPEQAYLIIGDRKLKMANIETGSFQYTFGKIKDEKNFNFEAAGFTSNSYRVKLLHRPTLKSFNVNLEYPRYLNKSSENLNNVGNFQVPEGTIVSWRFNTDFTNEIDLNFSNSVPVKLTEPHQNIFEYSKISIVSESYTLSLKNADAPGKDLIAYRISVIPDQFPAINLNVFQDTTLFNFILLSGHLNDDYGINKLDLYYSIDNQYITDKQQTYNKVTIPISGNQRSESFYYQWDLSDLKISLGNSISYYLQVWDNDAINGSKFSKTGLYTFKVPSKEEIKDNIDTSSRNNQSDIEKSIKEIEELKKKLEETQNRLKGKSKPDWQDEKNIKELLEMRNELEQALEILKEQNKSTDQKRNRFNEQSESIQEKAKKLQELMEELLDEETKKLYDELQRLLEEQGNSEDLQNKLEQIDFNEENLEKELERTLELFKRMQFEFKLEQTIEELNQLSEDQDNLSNETLDKNNEIEEISEKQEELNQDFQEFKNSLNELEEMNQDLKSPQSMEESNDEQEQIESQQQEGSKNLDNNKRKKASESQKNASDKMKQLSQKLQQMQNNMEVTMMQENLDHLRDIVHNLIQLSDDQESLMKEFREINQSDPRFVELSQDQLKLKDDAKVVEDSLISLANRVFQIQAFVTREVSEMNNHMDASLEALRDRNRNVIPLTTSKQQFAMTSMNNLALLLDDVMSQMMQALAEAMGNPKPGDQDPANMPSMSELQKQLGEKIKQLRESGKSGRELSEELAKLAAEQERIRRALQEAEEKLNQGEGDGGLEEIMEKMEENEIDLVNKKITEETIKRQREIETRLLEAEESLRERELDQKREGETANPYELAIPKAFEDYFKTKESEIELLKTVPPKLYPYYKKEVSDYFKRMGER